MGRNKKLRQIRSNQVPYRNDRKKSLVEVAAL